MTSKQPSLSKIARKAFPALLLSLCILISLIFLIRYTDAFYMVILIWIVIPVMVVKAHRRLKDYFAGKR